MSGATAQIPANGRDSDEFAEFSADVFFEILEEWDSSPENSSNSGDYQDDVEEDQNCYKVGESKAFWDGQDQLLQATLCRSSSNESKIRKATKEALKELNLEGTRCVCRRSVARGCRSCLQREISIRLQNAGFNCVICKSKWRSSSGIPSGEHTYLEVVDKSGPKKVETRVLIELNFRAEFEMARAGEEYNHLISRLPEVFVGKTERLRALIKILCSVAKLCMKEKNMHLGPWRKHKYMQAKWLGVCERSAPEIPLSVGFLGRPQKPRASMLTFHLRENLPTLHYTALEVS